VWVLATTGGATLAGLVAFARVLVRWTSARTDAPATLDDEAR
jgi:hypothetical protein